jgi:hypothetical protein
VTFLHAVPASGVVLCLGSVLGLKLIQHENSTQGRGLTAETREKWRQSEREREREREKDRERDKSTSSIFRDKKKLKLHVPCVSAPAKTKHIKHAVWGKKKLSLNSYSVVIYLINHLKSRVNLNYM